MATKRNVFIFNHPLIQHKIAELRDIATGHKKFRELVSEISLLMGYEATRELQTVDVIVETPLNMAKSKKLSAKVCLVPIFRAGLGMVESLLQLIPTAKVGHLGMYRDEHQKPVEYYNKLPPDIAESEVIILDPMLATGGSASAAIEIIKQAGAKNIRLLCIISATDGIYRVNQEHPDVRIYTAAEDELLNDHGYIVPGLGDAGDRLFGTK